MEYISLPPELSSYINSEKTDFKIKAGRANSFKKSYGLIFFGIIWLIFISIFTLSTLLPLFQGKEVHFTSNGKAVIANINNLKPLIEPGIFMGVFMLIGIIILFTGIYSLLKKGGYFVSTTTRLIHFYKGNIKTINWNQFTGNIEISGDSQKGNISLELRTGKMIHRKKGASRYVSNIIYIGNISNVFEIEKICRKRIKENNSIHPSKS